jgi:hypothetical protein
MYPKTGGAVGFMFVRCLSELHKEIALEWDSIEYSLYNKLGRTEPVHKELTSAAVKLYGNSVILSRVIKFS